MAEPNLWIVTFGLRGRQKNDFALRMKPVPGQFNQFFADAGLLVRNIHRKVRKITTIAKVGDRPGNSDKNIAVPGRAHKIGVREHIGNARCIIDWPALRQRGTSQNIDKLRGCDLAVMEVLDVLFHNDGQT